MSDAQPMDLAIISNEPTPYRLHVLKRIADELPDVRTCNIFTHTVSRPHVPWAVDVPDKLNPVFFDDCHMTPGFTGHLRILRARRLCRAIRDLLVSRKVRMVILLGYNDLVRLGLIRWANAAKLPLSVTGDSNVFALQRTGFLKRIAKPPLMRWVLRNVSGLMPMGVRGQDYFRHFADHQLPEFLFPYEPDYEALVDAGRRGKARLMDEHGLDPGRRRLLYCGRLASVKCVDDLIDAFSRIAGRCDNWDLVIAGDGPRRESLQLQVPDGLRNRVKWTGFLQFEQAAACYHCCDVLVLPSEFEPWGVVINEAVACSLAVVATVASGAAAELVRDEVNGMIVPPRDIASLAEALEHVTDAQVCQRMKDAAPDVLARWRNAADPVAGVRAALKHFGVIDDNG